MLFTQLTLHDFGVFGGRQTIDLTPPSPDQPVILFGGLNGGGKTTLLEGLQLALFGKQAPPYRSQGIRYEDYLAQAIHRGARQKDGAAIELTLKPQGRGEEVEYTLRRTWSVQNGKTKENFEVSVGGEVDRQLSERWHEYVENFIPPQLAHLIFFDGERIEALADPEQSQAILATAIDALLGIDLVGQLQGDLNILERRRRGEKGKGSKEKEELDNLEAELEEIQSEIQGLRQKEGGTRNEHDRLNKRLEEVEEKFRREGGDLFEEKEELGQQRKQLLSGQEETRRNLRELASGDLPLAMIRKPLLEDLKERDQKAEEKEEAEKESSFLQKLENELADFWEEEIPAEARRYLSEFFETKKEQAEAKSQAITPYVRLSSDARGQLYSLLNDILPLSVGGAQDLVEKAESYQGEINQVERKLEAVPEEEALAQTLRERQETQVQLEEVEGQLQEIQQEIQDKERESKRLQEKRDKARENWRKAYEKAEENQRFQEQVRKAKTTLDKFRQKALEQHAHRLEELIFDAYAQLLRKSSLVSGIQIDPETCALTLRSVGGQDIPPHELSAGERQLLAVSILWGLAKASGRPLPVTIDTPLGRLDGTHRGHLVQRYFPNASHQVLLLSTDEEIDTQNFERLKPWVGRSYSLDFADDDQKTVVREGYFFAEGETHAT